MNNSNEQWAVRARAAMPGGVLGVFGTPSDQPVVIASGRGSTVTDCDGREYVDYLLGSGPMIVGHSHPAVSKAVTAQASRGTHFYTVTPEAISLAELIVSASPCAEMVKFTSGGTEATFQALRLARAFTGRDKIVRFSGSFHGYHDYVMTDGSAGIPACIQNTVVMADFNDLQSVDRAVLSHPGEIAAILVEPLQRITVPSPDFLQGLRRIASGAGALLVFDEVVTGFRLAWGGAQEYYGVTPDIAAYGKIVGGGLPLGAVAGSREVMALANPNGVTDHYVYFSGTLNGNPLAAAAGLATLNLLSAPGSYQQLEEISGQLREGLGRLAAECKTPLQILGAGSIVGLVFGSGDPLDPSTVARGDKTALKALQSELLGRGVFCNLAAKLYLSVEHTSAQIERTLAATSDALHAIGAL